MKRIMRNRPANTSPSDSLGVGASASRGTFSNAGVERNAAASSCSAKRRSTSARRIASGHRSFKKEERFAAFPSRAASNSALTASQLSCCVVMDRFHLSVEPGFGHAPIPLHGLRGYTHQVGCLIHRQSTKKSQFHDLALPLIQLGQTLQSVIEFEEFLRLLGSKHQSLVDGNWLLASAPLIPHMPSGVVDQDSPHDLRRDPEKMRAALPIDRPLLDQLEICFVHQ